MTCVIDSSVWISAFHYDGTPLAALKRAYTTFQIAISDYIYDEICAALSDKFRWTPTGIKEAFAVSGPRTLKVETHDELRGICRDPKADMVLECAVAAGAAVIVTGDKDLLALGGYEGIRILTPRAFLDEFPA